MKVGHMVEVKNISFTIYCPNPAACPGGNSSNFSFMCAKGYENRSCASCAKGYAISDSSVLLCTRCPTKWWQQALQWLCMLGKHVLPFALAAKSALQGLDEKDRVQEEAKRSAVLINQLLSFATVTGGLLTVVAQTNAVGEIKSWAAKAVLEICGATTWLMGGEGPSEGFGGFGVSSLCLLTDLGLSGELWQAHLLHTAIPLALVLGLMYFRPSTQHGLVVVVGLNCFWPGVFSYFGKYLYCYQFAPESAAKQKEDTYDCPFTQDLGQRIALRIIMVLVFLMVSLVWIGLSLYKKDDKKPPLHVIFLSRAYRQSCHLWESERLMRKALLTLAVSALPITSSPALQLVCVLGVVVVSLFLYAALLPYKTMRFNLTECTLLATAALMTGIVSCLTAYDDYWGRVLQVEFLLIFTMVGLVVVTCFVMMFMIYLELRREWRNRPVPKEEQPWLWGTFLLSRSSLTNDRDTSSGDRAQMSPVALSS
ncbi:unnamed protein product [Symbiodinium pilosum]|uniref:TRP C-terminal domain-containing protein n=1 Tax=Symbiodinium pilosum TaxID=2952 RepID=A0A812TW46_SYMPI|nr:unnamed protein product [Symbiodinium pilosum]